MINKTNEITIKEREKNVKTTIVQWLTHWAFVPKIRVQIPVVAFLLNFERSKNEYFEVLC